MASTSPSSTPSMRASLTIGVAVRLSLILRVDEGEVEAIDVGNVGIIGPGLAGDLIVGDVNGEPLYLEIVLHGTIVLPVEHGVPVRGVGEGVPGVLHKVHNRLDHRVLLLVNLIGVDVVSGVETLCLGVADA